MCGILGSVNKIFDTLVLDLIKHRGADDFGIEEFEVSNNKVLLGQRRLSIIDLSPAGHQPMLSDCGNYAIIFNGEIYNHLDLKKKLPDSIIFRGHSDTETILYYLREFGIDGIKDLNGIFSIAYLDKIKSNLFLIRDPFGVKPLYYHYEKNELIFSSEIRPIKASVGNGELDKNALATLLRLRYNPSPNTLYNHIKKIRPGHYCEVQLSNNGLRLTHKPYLSEVPATGSYSPAKAIEVYGRKFEEAVERQLLSDVEVGILLSGGIDSAMVAAVAQKKLKGSLKCFTIGFEGEHEEDEIADAAETAQLLGLEHHYRKITFTDFLNTVKECTRIVEEPLATTSMIPMYFLSELASEKVKVVLTGQGADEPLGGYARYKLELIRDRIPLLLRNTIIPLVNAGRIRNERILRGANSLGIKHEIDRFLSIYEIFGVDEINKLISVNDKQSAEKIGYFYDLLKCGNKKHSVERMMALDSRLNLADDLLNYTDKITMNFSMECRVPILDLELVKFIESLPENFKLNMKTGKIVHKQFASTLLPEKIIHRKKRAFQSPTRAWFKNEADSIKELLLGSGTHFSAVFNQKYVSEIISQHQKGYNREKQIFLLLSIYFWLADN